MKQEYHCHLNFVKIAQKINYRSISLKNMEVEY